MNTYLIISCVLLATLTIAFGLPPQYGVGQREVVQERQVVRQDGYGGQQHIERRVVSQNNGFGQSEIRTEVRKTDTRGSMGGLGGNMGNREIIQRTDVIQNRNIG